MFCPYVYVFVSNLWFIDFSMILVHLIFYQFAGAILPQEGKITHQNREKFIIFSVY